MKSFLIPQFNISFTKPSVAITIKAMPEEVKEVGIIEGLRLSRNSRASLSSQRLIG